MARSQMAKASGVTEDRPFQGVNAFGGSVTDTQIDAKSIADPGHDPAAWPAAWREEGERRDGQQMYHAEVGRVSEVGYGMNGRYSPVRWQGGKGEDDGRH